MATCGSCKTKKARGQSCVKCTECVLINNLLMYAAHHRHSSPRDVLVKVIAGHYSSDEILQAKDLLVDKYGECGILHDDLKKHRQSSVNRTDCMANCEDIVAALGSIEENGYKLRCVTDDWGRLLKVHPEGTTDLSIADRVAEMAAKLTLMQTELHDTTRRVCNIESESVAHKEQMHQLVEDAMCRKQNSYAAKLSAEPPAIKSSMNPGPSVRKVVPPPQGVGNQPVPVPQQQRISATDRRPHSRSSSVPEAGGSYQTNDGFVRPPQQIRNEMKAFRYQQKLQMAKGSVDVPSAQNGTRPKDVSRRARNTGVMGAAKGPGLIPVAGPNREFYVQYVGKECDLDAMKEYIRGKGITERSLTIREGEDFNSFVLKVALSDAEKITDPSMWPEGIHVRRWYPSKRVNASN